MIIVSTKWFNKPKRKMLSLDDLAKLCDNTCQYCLQKFPIKDLTIDHIFPRSKGGTNTHDNRILSCGRCNRRKASFTPWYDINGNEPIPPKIPSIIISKSSCREEWKPFIER